MMTSHQVRGDVENGFSKHLRRLHGAQTTSSALGGRIPRREMVEQSPGDVMFPLRRREPAVNDVTEVKEVVEANLTGALTSQHASKGNNLAVDLTKQKSGVISIGNEIHNQNQFHVDQVRSDVTNQIYNKVTTRYERHVHRHQVSCHTLNVTYQTREQSSTSQAVKGNSSRFLAPTEDDVDDYGFKSQDLKRVVEVLRQHGRVLVSAHPGYKRKYLLLDLDRYYRKAGFTVYTVVDWERLKPVERGSVVIFDSAFGNARLEREQYNRFYHQCLYNTGGGSTRLVFVVYPHVLLELQQHDPASHAPLLNTLQIVEVGSDSFPSVQPYVDLLMRMLRDPSHKHLFGAVLALFMQGHGCFLDNPRQVQPHLERLGFQRYSDAQLEEYASLLTGSLLTKSSRGFNSRQIYDAVGLAFGRTHLKTVLLQVCDVRFFVQHVRAQLSAAEDPKAFIPYDEKEFLLKQRMLEEIQRGRLPEVIQHPCLQSAHFLQELEVLYRKEGRPGGVTTITDTKHGLPLLYWSIWGPSTCLTQWCLDAAKKERGPGGLGYERLFQAALGTALLSTVRNQDMSRTVLQFRDELAAKPSATFKTLRLPLPSPDQRHTKEVTETCQQLLTRLREAPFCYLGNASLPISDEVFTVEVVDNVMYLSLSYLEPYLLYRLLTDKQVDEADREGNTLLHLATEASNLDVIKLAIHSGSSLTVKNNAGMTPPQVSAKRWQRILGTRMPSLEIVSWCFDACKTGDSVSVRKWLCFSATVDDRDECGLTYLHTASLFGHTELCGLLIDLNADPNASDSSGRTPLHYASEQNRLEVARMLLERGSDSNSQDLEGATPLSLACECDHRGTAEVLLKHKADVNLRCDDGCTTLQNVCLQRHWDMAELLLRHDGDIDAMLYKDDDHGSLLTYAALHGQSKLAEFVVSHGAVVNKWSLHGWTPLHYACNFGSEDIVQLLLSHGADVDTTTLSDDTLLSLACSKGHTNVVRQLLDHGANVNTVTGQVSPLHCACDGGHTDVVRLLLTHDVDVNAQCEGGYTALHIACRAGHKYVVRLLVADIIVLEAESERGSPRYTVLERRNAVDVNARDCAGRTALFTACQAGWADIVRILLQRKDIDLDGGTDESPSPLRVACTEGRLDIARLLLRHKTYVNVASRDGGTYAPSRGQSLRTPPRRHAASSCGTALTSSWRTTIPA